LEVSCKKMEILDQTVAAQNRKRRLCGILCSTGSIPIS